MNKNYQNPISVMSTNERNTWYRKKKAAKAGKTQWQDHLLVVAFFLFLVFLVYL